MKSIIERIKNGNFKDSFITHEDEAKTKSAFEAAKATCEASGKAVKNGLFVDENGIYISNRLTALDDSEQTGVWLTKFGKVDFVQEGKEIFYTK